MVYDSLKLKNLTSLYIETQGTLFIGLIHIEYSQKVTRGSFKKNHLLGLIENTTKSCSLLSKGTSFLTCRLLAGLLTETHVSGHLP